MAYTTDWKLPGYEMQVAERTRRHPLSAADRGRMGIRLSRGYDRAMVLRERRTPRLRGISPHLDGRPLSYWTAASQSLETSRFARDISERKRAERALRTFSDELKRQVLVQTEELRELNATLEARVAERTAKLAETNEELAAYAHTVSHDLRAPLRAMEGFAGALLEDYGDRLDENACQYIENIADSARRMDALTSDLLVYSRLGRTEIRG